jgi:predicted ArsR family transcriptional regulator
MEKYIMSKTNAMLQALKSGQRFTAKQAAHRFGFANPQTAMTQLSKLRFQGYAVYANRETNDLGETYTKYRLGKPTRAVIAAGYRALANGNA